MSRIFSVFLVIAWSVTYLAGPAWAEKQRPEAYAAKTPASARKPSLPTQGELKKQIEALEAKSQEQEAVIRDLQTRLERLESLKAPSEAAGAPAPVKTPGAEPTPGEAPQPEIPPPIEVPTAEVTAPPPPSATPAGAGGSLNPDISVLGRFLARTSTDRLLPANNALTMDELEVSFQHVVDPYTRFDAFVTIPNGGTAEVEEAAISTLHLPWGLQAKAGFLKAEFGKTNTLHSHEFPQVDRPDSLVSFVGEEGLAGPGVQLSGILPFPWYSELTGQVLNNENTTAFSGGTSARKILVGRWRNLWDLNEDTTLDLGLSWADGVNTPGSPPLYTTLKGADLTVKWKPLRRAIYNTLIWSTELMGSRRDVAPDVTVDGNGWFSYLSYQLNRLWWIGARYDDTGTPADGSARARSKSLYVTMRPTEFNQLRLQYKRSEFTVGDALDQFFFTWDVNIGPHGAHRY
ncbi:MAG: hypothetical protein HYU64_06480 [Armatimonadetes bacterium]|nr:hypothetical protein [Armatimonadota bacterium]